MKEKIDYFDLWQKPKPKRGVSKKFILNIVDEVRNVEKVKKDNNITEADRLRKTEIRAAKTEIYHLRTTGRPKVEYKVDITTKNRREELINCKRILNSELYR